MTLAKYNTKNGSPNDRRKRKRALEQELEELRIKNSHTSSAMEKAKKIQKSSLRRSWRPVR